MLALNVFFLYFSCAKGNRAKQKRKLSTKTLSINFTDNRLHNIEMFEFRKKFISFVMPLILTISKRTADDKENGCTRHVNEFRFYSLGYVSVGVY